MSTIPDDDRNNNMRTIDLARDDLPTERALGVEWNLETDTVRIKTSYIAKPATRRGVLSITSSIFDPLGLLAPFTLRGKLIFQDEVRQKTDWDDKLSSTSMPEWERWLRDLDKLKSFSLPRCYKPEGFGVVSHAQLHHFCDASQRAYATASYLRLQNTRGETHCTLVSAKTRLAPVKPTTIPRLELCAAVLAANADSTLRKELAINISNSYFWSDSEIVLCYLNNVDKRFKTFVANRVGTILRFSRPDQWRHVSSELNPADDASRGLSADDLLHPGRWISGPGYLRYPEKDWPKPKGTRMDLSNDPEIKKVITFTAVTTPVRNLTDELLERYSSWLKLRKAVAWLTAFSRWRRHTPGTTPMKIDTGAIKLAKTAILRYVQQRHYGNELKALQEGKVLRHSNLYRLEPWLSKDGLLCVGGRATQIHHRTDDSGPIILPRDHHVTKIILREIHEGAAGHSGREHTLACSRRSYWITACRPLLDRILRECITCRRVNGRPGQQRQGDLPRERITPRRSPFTYTGVDCFGPFHVRNARKPAKRYGCIFTCMATRAVHIEMLYSLEADSFLNAMTCFMALRGHPERMFSDNGTNFVKAEKDLRSAFKSWRSTPLAKDMLRKQGIEWVFNPPGASHMGGVWERQIRSVRKIMLSVVGKQTIDDERLRALFCEAAATLNRRPLTTVPNSCQDLEALTPDHLLRIDSSDDLPPGGPLTEDRYRRRWKHAQWLADQFWKRWRKEYVVNLKRRQKSITPSRNLATGDLVLLVDENLPRNQWRLGRVKEAMRSSDGLVRKVRVKTQAGTLIRPITKLCLLEGVTAEATIPGCSTRATPHASHPDVLDTQVQRGGECSH